MSTATFNLPPPEEILGRIDAVQEELASLRRLLRASQAATKAEEARKRRQPSGGGWAHSEPGRPQA